MDPAPSWIDPGDFLVYKRDGVRARNPRWGDCTSSSPGQFTVDEGQDIVLHGKMIGKIQWHGSAFRHRNVRFGEVTRNFWKEIMDKDVHNTKIFKEAIEMAQQHGLEWSGYARNYNYVFQPKTERFREGKQTV
jgi:hypothetical protein